MALADQFRHTDGVAVAGNSFADYEERNPDKSIAPDVFVVLDHGVGKRGLYRILEVGKPPAVALEVISPSSEIRNALDKRDPYERPGIWE